MGTEPNGKPEEELCPAGLECPKCGENRTNRLWWDQDGVHVTCDTCGCVYEPPERPPHDTEEDQ